MRAISTFSFVFVLGTIGLNGCTPRVESDPGTSRDNGLSAAPAGNGGGESPIRDQVITSVPATPMTPLPVPTDPGPGPESLLGEPLPAFEVRDIHENAISNQHLRGHVVLVDFWATWCGPCKEASPIMQSLHDRYASRGLIVIGANTSERENGESLRTPDRAAAYAHEHGYTYTFAYGADDLKDACRVQGLPTMLIVDPLGRIRHVQVGFSPTLEAELRAAIEPLLD